MTAWRSFAAFPAFGACSTVIRSAEDAMTYARMGWYDFTGVVTYKNARKVIEVIKTVPLDRMMIETTHRILHPSARGRCDSTYCTSLPKRSPGARLDPGNRGAPCHRKRVFSIS